MDLTFFKINESHNAMEFELSSPNELQDYEKALASEIPEGQYRDVRRGKSPSGRPTLTLGVVPIGERVPLRGQETQPAKPTPPPAALEIPANVKAATDEKLEVMATARGIEVTDGWRKKNRQLREASVARAGLKLQSVGG